jgi:hypothetical protein
MGKKTRKLQATVRKVLPPRVPGEKEKAEISIQEAEDLYKEIRIENTVTDDQGRKEKLKEGEPVDVVLATDSDAKKKAS